ncbi:HU family DNA-binding protein [Parabacteroides sp.]
MNKRDLINELSLRLNLRQYESQRILDECLKILSEHLADGETIVMQGFGTLRPWMQTSRMGRNPRTGETCEILPRISVKFKPGKLLLKDLNDTNK